jgi:DNA-directed RNA polymerase subunit RPC12/RpoP
MNVLKDEYNTMKVKCPHCNSLLQINANDLKGGDVSEFFYDCGACHRTAIVPSVQIPKHILAQTERAIRNP